MELTLEAAIKRSRPVHTLGSGSLGYGQKDDCVRALFGRCSDDLEFGLIC
ncbi:MAG TPA: hypothetical protein V6C57_22265 [Coleofasciculaceae cyanobacterium]